MRRRPGAGVRRISSEQDNLPDSQLDQTQDTCLRSLLTIYIRLYLHPYTYQVCVKAYPPPPPPHVAPENSAPAITLCDCSKRRLPKHFVLLSLHVEK